MSEALRRTPLHALHAELGARFTPFAGYEMPVQYKDGLRAEHLHTREQAGLFDVSHMGQVRVTGPGLTASLERALPVDFDDWPVGRQRYTLLCNEKGGIEDDLMVTRLASEVRLVVNASTKEKDLAFLRRLCPDLSFELLDYALIALQGPLAERTLATLAPEAVELRFMNVAMLPIAGAECLVSRSGYTGEDGYEISVPAADAGRLARSAARGARGEAGRSRRARHAAARSRAASLRPGHGRRYHRARSEPWLGDRAIAARRRQETRRLPRRATSICARAPTASHAGWWAWSARRPYPCVTARRSSPRTEADAGIVTSGTVSPSTGKAIMLGFRSQTRRPHEALRRRTRRAPRPVRARQLPFVPKRYKSGTGT